MEEKNAVGEFLDRIYPNHGELQVDKYGTLYTILIDEETDGFLCSFIKMNDEEVDVHIHTDPYSYLQLNLGTVYLITDLIEEAQQIYSERTEKEWEKFFAIEEEDQEKKSDKDKKGGGAH